MTGQNPYELNLCSFYQSSTFFYEEGYTHNARQVYRASTGKLIVSVYEINTEKPIKGATVTIQSEESHFQGIQSFLTNESGQTDVIFLPAPPKEYALDPSGPKAYSEYTVIIEFPNYKREIRKVRIFADTTAKQKVEIIPIRRTTNHQSL
ncbi:hypothetical protein V7024_06685 [Bacillus sp. JJ864]|uniref:hypothetical protein n=1 Tax=Bacillus sp. JJ864 TaxID=3122975 RepID=UPI002FFF480E